MLPTHLVQFIHAAPFRPFRLFLADGRSIEAGAADCLTFSPDGRGLFIFLPDTDEHELLDLALVVSARVSEGEAASVA